jgi:sugar-specific transcriptional regulator TrmB
LNEKEIAVYLGLLELGSQPASVVAKKAKINRSTTYLILESLMKKDLVDQYVRADVKYFTAADPQVIVKSLKQKEGKLKKTRNDLTSLLPELYSLSNPLSTKPRVRFYEGEEGVKRAMEDTLTASDILLSYDALDSWFDSTPALQEYIMEYAMLRAHKHKIPLKSLFLDSPRVREYIVEKYPPHQNKVDPLLEFRWIPKDISPFNIELNIYDDKVSIVSLAKNELLGVIIESHEIAKIHKSIFELAWRTAKKN